MVRYHYERLSALDASFLWVEGPRSFCHSTSVLVFEPGTLRRPGGGVDFDELRHAIDARLAHVPRYRQRLKWVPVEDHPVWVDDPEFNLDYHLRHTSLPRPGNAAQLDRLVARVHSQRLDRNRPLWECWVAEGLEGDRFALLLKVHHCLADMPTNPDLLQLLLSADPAEARPEPEPYRPRPLPSALELARDELLRRVWLPGRAAGQLRAFARESGNLQRELWRRAEAVARLAGLTLRPSRRKPLGGPPGPHRRFEHRALPLADAVAVRRALGGSVNDVVLAAVAGAVRRFLQERLVNPATVDLRVAVPVRLADGDARNPGFDQWVIELPVWERDPLRRHTRIREQTRALQRRQPALGARTLFSVAEWAGSRALSSTARHLASRAPVDLEVTYVPGPETPLYLRGARLVRGFGCAPLQHGNTLAIAVFACEGNLCFGLNADFDALPDLSRFVRDLEDSLRELQRAAQGRGGHLSLVAS